MNYTNKQYVKTVVVDEGMKSVYVFITEIIWTTIDIIFDDP